jgi:hypothetical protein
MDRDDMSNPWWKFWGRSQPQATRHLPTTLERQDGFQSAIMGLGVPGRDKTMSVNHVTRVVTDVEAMDLWRGNDIAKKAIEVIPEEMFRQGWDIKMDDKEMAEALMARCEELAVTAALQRAKQFERAYGGAAIVSTINDGASDLSEPLNERNIMQITGLKVYEPRELHPLRFYEDPRSEKYNEPMTWQLVPISGRRVQLGEIHESRMIIFPGIRVSNDDAQGTRAHWGDSVLTAMEEVLQKFGITWSAVGALIADFAQAVFKIKNLAGIFASDNDQAFYKRLQAMDLSRSVLRSIVIDAEEDYERKATPMSGLPEILELFMTRMASASDLPGTRLFGMSPAGLNATGESDRAFLEDRVVAQYPQLQPLHERLVKLIMLSKDGPLRGREPRLWSIEYRPLRQMDEKTRAEARYIQAQTDVLYIQNGVLSPEEVALSRFGGDTYSYETVVDFGARRLLEAHEPAQLTAGDQPDEDEADASEDEQRGDIEDWEVEAYRMDYVEKVGGRWQVRNKETGEVLSEYDTEEQAHDEVRTIDPTFAGALPGWREKV